MGLGEKGVGGEGEKGGVWVLPLHLTQTPHVVCLVESTLIIP